MDKPQIPFYLSFLNICISLITLVLFFFSSLFLLVLISSLYIIPTHLLLIATIAILPSFYLLFCSKRGAKYDIKEDKESRKKPSLTALILSVIFMLISLVEIFIPTILGILFIVRVINPESGTVEETIVYNLSTVGESVFGGIVGFYLAQKYFYKYYNQPIINQIFGTLEQKREEINTLTQKSSEQFQPHKFLEENNSEESSE